MTNVDMSLVYKVRMNLTIQNKI